MLVRTCAIRALRQTRCVKRPPVSRYTVRKLSGTSSTASDASTSSTHPLSGLTSQFDDIAPRFEIDADHVEILDGPASFYKTLKDKILGAKRRVYLSTLYIGKTESELIDTLEDALDRNPDLQVSILTDALRGTREAPEQSCASLLVPLITKFGSRVEVWMFHTPNLTGWRKKYIPRRINEGWGLQHMKLYGFDDEIMLSGANLSNDYFNNRLDRYHIFKSKKLTDYYHKIHNAVCELSYRLVPDTKQPSGFQLESPLHRGLPDPVWHPKRFKLYAKQQLQDLIEVKARQKMFPRLFTQGTTFVYPVAQFDILLGRASRISAYEYEMPEYTSTEKPLLSKLLQNFQAGKSLQNASWTFTAGYFNIDPEICDLLIDAAPAAGSETKQFTSTSSKPCTVITASPWANGFYGSAGISGMLPAAYTLLSRHFLRAVAKEGKEPAIALKEWRKGTVGQPGGWTYHAKGIWATLQPPPNETDPDGTKDEVGPSITLIGSSNYTKRSYSLDLEIGAMIVTDDEGLKKRLKQETEWLEKDATVTTKDDLSKGDRRVGFKVRVAMWLVERLGGAL